MKDLLFQPLEFAVFDIIANSHLTNGNDYQFVPAYNLDELGFNESPRWPYVTAQSLLLTADDEEIEMGLTVGIATLFPTLSSSDTEAIRYQKAVAIATTYQQDLLAIFQHLTGKKGSKFDFDLVGKSNFQLDYKPVLPNKDELDGKRRVNELIIIAMDMTFRGRHEELSGNRFSPSEAGTHWAEFLLQ